MKNKIFGMLATIMMGGAVMTGLTACSNTDNNDGNDQQKRVALLLPDNSRIDRWGTDLKNLEDAMATYGIKTTSYVAPETAEGAAEQVEQLKKAINDGVKYIVLTTVDYKKINESGLLEQHPDVKLVCHDRFVFDNPRIAFFSSTNTKDVGRTQAQFLIDKFQASGKASMTLEILQGPSTDGNSKDYYDGAIELLQKYIDDGKLVVKSGKTTFDDVKGDSWDVADQKKAMADRLKSYATGECPDMVLAATDNAAQGAVGWHHQHAHHHRSGQLARFAGAYQERQADHDHRQEPEGHGQQHRHDCLQPDDEPADYRHPDRCRHPDRLL